MGKRRPSGDGMVRKREDGRWEGRYSPVWPDGKKHSRNIYAKTREGCEEKLKVLILEMKAEIAALRSGASTEYPDGVLVTIDCTQSLIKCGNLPMFAEPLFAPAYETNAPRCP